MITSLQNLVTDTSTSREVYDKIGLGFQDSLPNGRQNLGCASESSIVSLYIHQWRIFLFCMHLANYNTLGNLQLVSHNLPFHFPYSTCTASVYHIDFIHLFTSIKSGLEPQGWFSGD